MELGQKHGGKVRGTTEPEIQESHQAQRQLVSPAPTRHMVTNFCFSLCLFFPCSIYTQHTASFHCITLDIIYSFEAT